MYTQYLWCQYTCIYWQFQCMLYLYMLTVQYTPHWEPYYSLNLWWSWHVLLVSESKSSSSSSWTPCVFVRRSGSQMSVYESHETFCSLDNIIAFLRTRLPWAHSVRSIFGCDNLFLYLLCIHKILVVQVVLLGKTVSFPCVLEDVMMESAHYTVTRITLWTRVSLKKSNVKLFPSTASLHTDAKSSWEGFLINLCVTVRLVCLLATGEVMSLSISITSLSHSHSDITRLSVALSACCSVYFFSL